MSVQTELAEMQARSVWIDGGGLARPGMPLQTWNFAEPGTLGSWLWRAIWLRRRREDPTLVVCLQHKVWAGEHDWKRRED